MSPPRCSEHKDLVSKITSVSESLHGLRGELKIIVPEIKKTSTLMNKLAQKISREEGSRKASWKTVTISVAIGALLSGLLWSALSFFQRVA